ncbi:hypothetical protein NVS55_40105 (plasmid) [Myxococcus stipitatus]|uniref:hypothetical protein n=1 Tax=Myxococcus stipitatus TaxID=83455 RepID=UPI00314514BB
MTRLALLLVLLLPHLARADRRELYTQLALGPAVLFLSDPAGSSSTATHPALSVELSTFYGLTNSFHLGGTIRFTGTRNARYASIGVALPDGSLPLGSLYLDAWSLGAAALVAYRHDTGLDLAPTARVELGLAHSAYQRRELIPATRNYSLTLPSVSDFAPTARAVVGIEYRFRDSLVASAGLGIRRAFGSSLPWTLDIPLNFGVIW